MNLIRLVNTILLLLLVPDKSSSSEYVIFCIGFDIINPSSCCRIQKNNGFITKTVLFTWPANENTCSFDLNILAINIFKSKKSFLGFSKDFSLTNIPYFISNFITVDQLIARITLCIFNLDFVWTTNQSSKHKDY